VQVSVVYDAVAALWLVDDSRRDYLQRIVLSGTVPPRPVFPAPAFVDVRGDPVLDLANRIVKRPSSKELWRVDLFPQTLEGVFSHLVCAPILLWPVVLTSVPCRCSEISMQ
jgi:hypothetical protein